MSLSTAAVADAVNACSMAQTQDGLNNDPGHCSHVAILTMIGISGNSFLKKPSFLYSGLNELPHS